MSRKKQAIEQLRQTATEDILSMQAAWQNEKTVLQQQAYDEGFQVGYEEGHNKVIIRYGSLYSVLQMKRRSYPMKMHVNIL